MKIHRDFSDISCSLVEAFFLGTAIPATPHQTLQSMISSQQDIGLEYMVRGFVALDWKAALKESESGAQAAESKMATLVQSLWNDVIGPIWKARNDILRRAANYTTTLENEQLGQQLHWYDMITSWPALAHRIYLGCRGQSDGSGSDTLIRLERRMR
jgi:hypothetical protein